MSESGASASFTCQRCLQPLRLSAELGEIAASELAEVPGIGGGAGTGAGEREEREGEEFDHAVDDDFTLVSSSGRLDRKAALFDALSDGSDVDHPLCDECTDALLQLVDERLAVAEEEWRSYGAHLARLERDEEREVDAEALKREAEERRREERRLLAELEALRCEEDEAEREAEARERERRRLAEEEAAYLREYARHRKELADEEERAGRCEARLTRARSQLERLKKTNALKAAFRVSDSGRFGVVNGFRLGRLPDAPVDWSEINAAWGQTALLLSSLARRIGLDFERFRPVPYGSRSYVLSLEDGRELPLYSAGGFKLLWDVKFDSATVAFLDCLRQFKDCVEAGDGAFRLPFQIDGGKIRDPATGQTHSIKVQFNSEEQWTKALRLMLTNLKWGLTWVSSRFEA